MPPKKRDATPAATDATRGSRTNLVIVESAAKAKTIQGYLNTTPELAPLGTFKVAASFGHIDNLPLKELGVDTETWTATYEPLADKRKVLAELRAAARDADFVYIASDNDLEGECIADHLRTALHLRPAHSARVTFNEITRAALRTAIQSPRPIDAAKVAAQEARRIVDRITGYVLSPLLWRRFAGAGRGLSAGRVQSAALRLIVDRARAAANHTPAPFWTLTGDWTLVAPTTLNSADPAAPTLTARATAAAPTAAPALTTPEAALAALRAVAPPAVAADAWTAEFRRKTVLKSPPPPFTTSTLQQDAYNRFGLSAKDTMRIAQGLYESGKITYMRTDSTALAEEAVGNVLAHVRDAYGPDDAQPRAYKPAAVNAQEAHEAIRPTNVTVDADALGLEGIAARLYDLIRRRTIACQMAPARYAELQYTIRAAPSAPSVPSVPTFHGTQRVLTDPGYLKVLSPTTAPTDASTPSPTPAADWADLLKGPVPVRAQRFAAEGDVTRPPPLYQESSLVKALERLGIGRPSTYAGILDKLTAKHYTAKGTGPQTVVPIQSYEAAPPSAAVATSDRTVTVGGDGTDKLVPTALGERVTDYLLNAVPYLLDSDFTAKMEADLDRISHGATTKNDVLNAFYGRFQADVARERTALAAAGAAADRPKTARGAPAASAAGPGPGPSNVLRRLGNGISVVQTKYGLALFKPETPEAKAKFVSLAPFLKWRAIGIAALTDADAATLMLLPMPVVDGRGAPAAFLTLGPYGFYLKTPDGRNCRLPESDWDAAFAGRLRPDTLHAALNAAPGAPDKKKWIPRKKLGANAGN